MIKIKRQHPELKALYLPRHGGDKDISDYRKNHGARKTQELINSIKEKYVKEESGNTNGGTET